MTIARKYILIFKMISEGEQCFHQRAFKRPLSQVSGPLKAQGNTEMNVGKIRTSFFSFFFNGRLNDEQQLQSGFKNILSQ